MWFVKRVEGINGWFMIYIGDGVENRFVVMHEKVNGWWELRGSMKHDELGDMGYLVPMRMKVY